jgi:general stress protein 26
MKLETKVLDFLNKHRICAMSTMLWDGSPHVCALHYANSEKGETYIMTEKSGRKSEALLDGTKGKASFVTGFSDEEWITLQMDGEVKAITNKKELLEIHKVYYAKNPGPEKYKNDPATLFLVFKPTWYRYTEYKPKFLVISSEK